LINTGRHSENAPITQTL